MLRRTLASLAREAAETAWAIRRPGARAALTAALTASACRVAAGRLTP